METITQKTFDEERALYQSNNLNLIDCSFKGVADGESALKESCNIKVEKTLCALRYPFWHCKNLFINNCKMEDTCRAALWYSHNVEINTTKMFGIKALRESGNIKIKDCEISSPEFGWFCNDVNMKNTKANSEYFMLKSRNLDFEKIQFEGKYSFQYVENANICDCVLNTKDAFWHGKNIVIKDCEINGEYLAWYSENLTFENCIIRGTQPFCWCKNLRLINCKMENADLCFEKSEVDAEIFSDVQSVKNPESGIMRVQNVHEIIIENTTVQEQKSFNYTIIIG